MALNTEEAPEYREVLWKIPAGEKEALVIHTLCIPPDCAGKGCGTRMVEFAKDFAREKGLRVIRIDTYAGNEPAKRLYKKLGFTIAGEGRIRLQGLIDEDQVYLGCAV